MIESIQREYAKEMQALIQGLVDGGLHEHLNVCIFERFMSNL